MNMTATDLESLATVTAKVTRFGYSSAEALPEDVTPLYDWLLVKRIYEGPGNGLLVAPDLTMTKDGRWVRKTDEGPYKGLVVAAGRGDKRPTGSLLSNGTVTMAHTVRVPMDVKVGDTIIYPRFESSHIVLQDEKYTFVHEADVMAVIEP